MAGVKGKSGGKRKGAGRKAALIENARTFSEIGEVYDTMQTCNEKDLLFPKELESIPGAREIWDEVIYLDKQSKYSLLNARHKEILKSYCYSVAMRNTLISLLSQGQVTYEKNGEVRVNPIINAINKLNKDIHEQSDDLGLTVLSSYKIAVMAKNGESLDGKADDTADGGDDLFD